MAVIRPVAVRASVNNKTCTPTEAGTRIDTVRRGLRDITRPPSTKGWRAVPRTVLTRDRSPLMTADEGMRTGFLPNSLASKASVLSLMTLTGCSEIALGIGVSIFFVALLYVIHKESPKKTEQRLFTEAELAIPTVPWALTVEKKVPSADDDEPIDITFKGRLSDLHVRFEGNYNRDEALELILQQIADAFPKEPEIFVDVIVSMDHKGIPHITRVPGGINISIEFQLYSRDWKEHVAEAYRQGLSDYHLAGEDLSLLIKAKTK